MGSEGNATLMVNFQSSMNSPMKALLRSSLALLTLLVTFATSAAAKSHSGQVDFSSFIPTESGRVVQITVGPVLLKFAAMVASFEDPEAAKLLRSIKHVRVNVVELDKSNRADAASKIADVRAHLKSGGWEPTVQVREKNQQEEVDVYIKLGSDDTIEGIVVTVIDDNKEAVFVNVVGRIKAEQIAALCDSLDIDALDDIDLKHSKRVSRKG